MLAFSGFDKETSPPEAIFCPAEPKDKVITGTDIVATEAILAIVKVCRFGYSRQMRLSGMRHRLISGELMLRLAAQGGSFPPLQRLLAASDS